LGVIFYGCFRATEKHKGSKTGKLERFSTADARRWKKGWEYGDEADL